jgi:hypothetical protein
MPYLILSKEDEKYLELEASNFVPLHYINEQFNLDIKKLPLTGEDISGNLVRLGKVVSQNSNIGLALVDINKLDALGGNAKYTIGNYRVIVWQPEWLDMVRSNKIKE